MKNFIHEKETIVIGSTLSALCYAYFNNLPVLSGVPEPPDFILRHTAGTNLEELGLKNNQITLKSPDGDIHLGDKKYITWQRLWWLLSFCGLLPLGDKPESLIIEDDIIKAPCKGRISKYRFENLIIFSDKNVFGIPAEPFEADDVSNYVYDYYDVTFNKRGHKFKYDYFKLPDSELCRDLLFYDRFEDTWFKSLVGISTLTNEQISKSDYSDVIARFKINFFLKKYKQWATLVPKGRTIRPIRMRYYVNFKNNITFRRDTIENILENGDSMDTTAIDYVWKNLF